MGEEKMTSTYYIIKNIDKKIRELNKEIREQKAIHDQSQKDEDGLKKKYKNNWQDEFGRYVSHMDDPEYNYIYQTQLQAFIKMEELKEKKQMLRDLKK